MNKWYEWIFSGIGSSIVTAIIGFFFGYKTGFRKAIIDQSQAAGTGAKQSQIGSRNSFEAGKKKISQTQKADSDAEQVQIGEE